MTPIILISIGLAVLLAYVFWRKSRKPLTTEKRVNKIKNRKRLPSGMELWIEDGANVTALEVLAIEAGMQECFERAGVAGYQHPVQLSDYTVAILGDCIWRNGAYVFTMPMPPEYAGSTYDDGSGLLYIAGQYLERSDINLIVLPDYDGEHLDVLARVAGYECEHAVLRHSDPVKYQQTKIHTPEFPHPLF